MTRATVWFFCLLIVCSSSAFAQDDDTVLQPAQPDFTLAALPTSLRLPQFKSAFRVTHRFTRPLDCDTCATTSIVRMRPAAR